MSGHAIQEPIAATIEGRPRDLGGFVVRRVLPAVERRSVGPFVFFDHMGPDVLPIGQGIDVRPHPHIGLATVTYLFEGEIIHRDSLGFDQPIRPGAINWMIAGRGIVHSERTAEAERARGPRLHGIQLWVALPTAHEEAAPEFFHHPSDTLPEQEQSGVRLRILAGAAYGARSPVKAYSTLFYVEALMAAGSTLALPTDYPEHAAYIVEGTVSIGETRPAAPSMLVFEEDAKVLLKAETAARVMLLGGEPLDGERHLWWNFVSSSRERIEQAKADWKQGRFPSVPGEDEFIPLPE